MRLVGLATEILKRVGCIFRLVAGVPFRERGKMENWWSVERASFRLQVPVITS